MTLNPEKTLANAPLPVIYHLVSTQTALQDKTILHLLEAKPPPSRINGWPDFSPPPGFLLLLMHQNAEVRKWAKSHVSQVKGIPYTQFTEAHMSTLCIIVQAVSSGSSSVKINGSSAVSNFPFPSDSEALWHNFIHVIPLVPREVLQSKDNEVRLSRVIIGHLNDNAARKSIKKCFMFEVYSYRFNRLPNSSTIVCVAH